MPYSGKKEEKQNNKTAFKTAFEEISDRGISDHRLAWLAAVIECEGSISFQCLLRGKHKDRLSIVPFVNITNSDKLLLEEAKRLFDILSERSFGSKPRYCKNYHHGVRPGYTNSKGYTTNQDCKNLRIDGQATKLILMPCLPFFRSNKKTNAGIVLNFLKNRQENLIQRDKLGRIIRKGYTKYELEKICSVRTHPRALTYNEMIECKNVVN